MHFAQNQTRVDASQSLCNVLVRYFFSVLAPVCVRPEPLLGQTCLSPGKRGRVQHSKITARNRLELLFMLVFSSFLHLSYNILLQKEKYL